MINGPTMQGNLPPGTQTRKTNTVTHLLPNANPTHFYCLVSLPFGLYLCTSIHPSPFVRMHLLAYFHRYFNPLSFTWDPPHVVFF